MIETQPIRSTRWPIVASVTAAVVFVGALLVRPGGAGAVKAIDDLGQMVIAAWAAASCFRAMVRAGAGPGDAPDRAEATGAEATGAEAPTTDSAVLGTDSEKTTHTRVGWALLGAGAASWALGEAVWSWYELVAGRDVPFPSLADLGYLTAVPLIIAGVLAFVHSPTSARSRLRGISQAMIIANGLLFISWVFVLGPAYRGADPNIFKAGVGLAYPLGDILTLSVVLFAATRRESNRQVPLGLLAAGLGALALSDSGFAYLTQTGKYSTGNLIDAGWPVGFCLVAIAAWRYKAGRRQEHRVQAGRLSVAMPYLPVAGAAAVALARTAMGRSFDAFMVYDLAAAVVIIVVHQLAISLENQGLTRNLEDKVRARTAELATRERRFRALVQASSDFITVIDADLTIRWVSESAGRIYGWSPSDLLDAPLASMAQAADMPALLATIGRVRNSPGASSTMNWTLRRSDGQPRQCETTFTNLLDDPAVHGLVLNTRDVTEARLLEDELRHQAFHDSLTGLANRALFRDRLEHALQRRGRTPGNLAVLYIDIDAFKDVNDGLGHAEGDVLLVATASRIRDSLRSADSLARLGGDEFAILLEDVGSSEDALAVAENVLNAMHRPIALNDREIHVTISVGVVLPSDSASADAVLRDADVAMYAAKAAGKDRVQLFEPGMHAQALDHLELLADLKHAVDRDELVLHYQPIYGFATGDISGFEALVRWQHPRRGLLYPDAFIPMAEESGLIIAIGRWVLQRACAQAREWLEEHGRPYHLSVNLSARQLFSETLVEEVSQVLDATRLDPSALTLEVTESTLLDDVELTISRLRALQQLGVCVSLDDFGTGFSGLSYLGRFPIDELKVDKSFVALLRETYEPGHALVDTIIGLGKRLGLRTVVEGIENEYQLSRVIDAGCDAGQGYYFSRPVPPEAVCELIAAGPCGLLAPASPEMAASGR